VGRVAGAAVRLILRILLGDRGISEIVDEALLVAFGIALFLALVVSPIRNVISFIWDLPVNVEAGFQTIVEELSKIWSSIGP